MLEERRSGGSLLFSTSLETALVLYNYTMLTVQDISTGFAQEASPYPLKRAYLFGSQARGNASNDSDIDILLMLKKDFPFLIYVDLRMP